VIERRTSSDPFADVASPGSNADTYSDTGLAANTTYTDRVRVTNNAGSTYSANASATSLLSGNGTGFPAWIDGFPALPIDERNPTDDWDEDGAANLLEFALKLNPTQPDANQLPRAMVVEDGASRYLHLTYRQRTGDTGTTGIDHPIEGITYVVEVSPELIPSDWQSINLLVEQIGTPVDNGDDTATVTVRIKAAVGGDPRKFARLKVILQ